MSLFDTFKHKYNTRNKGAPVIILNKNTTFNNSLVFFFLQDEYVMGELPNKIKQTKTNKSFSITIIKTKLENY